LSRSQYTLRPIQCSRGFRLRMLQVPCVVDILQYEHTWLCWDGDEVIPEIHTVVVAASRHRSVRAADLSSYRVAQHRLEVRKTGILQLRKRSLRSVALR
jgi:hypothetical protein